MTWWNWGWRYRKSITIKSSKVADNHSNFPILFSEVDVNLKRHVTQANAEDVAFFDSDGFTQLDHEIEKWDGSDGTLVAHVRIPVMDKDNDKKIYIYYGRLVSDDQQNITGVWDDNFKGVWHLKDITPSTVADSTSNNNDGTKTAANEPIEVDGKINDAQDFDGINDYVNVGALSTADFSSGISISAWVKSSHTSITGIVYQAEDDYGATTGIADGHYWKGRQGIDTSGGLLFNHVYPNTDYGCQTITITGYQSSAGAVAGTYEVIDEVTEDVLASGNLSVKLVDDSDKRINGTFIFGGTGHDYRVKIYFSDTRDLYIDRVSCYRLGYEGILVKSGMANFFLNSVTFRIVLYSTTASKSRTFGTITPGTWQHADITWDNSNIRTYVNGDLINTTPFVGVLKTSANNFNIGWSNAHGTKAKLLGKEDEVRLSNTARSTEWILTSFNTQSDPGSFYILGRQETDRGAPRRVRRDKEYSLEIGVPVYKEGYKEFGVYSPLGIEKRKELSMISNVSKEIEKELGISATLNHEKLARIIKAL